MKCTYSAVDGYNLDGNETFASLMAEDSILGDNLLSDPSNTSTWTSDSDGTISQQDNQTIKHTITHVSNAAGAGAAISTISGTYYLFRVYGYLDSVTSANIYASTSLNGSSNLGISTAKSITGVHELIFKATSAISYVHLRAITPQNGIMYWSNIEVIKLSHYGVDETTDYITNGDFGTALGAEWVAGNANSTLSLVSGALRVTSVANGVSYAYQAITTESGKMYSCTVDLVTDGATGQSFLYAGSTQGNSDLGYFATGAVVGTYTIYFKATGATTYISLAASSSILAGEYFEWDNVVVTETGNLVANGGFNTDIVWTKGTGWTISGGVATHAAGTGGNIYEGTSADSEKNVKVLSITISGMTTGTLTPYLQKVVGTAITANGTYYQTIDTSGSQSAVTDSFVLFSASSTFDGSIDNVTVRRAYPVLDSNGDAAEIYGEIVEAPVNYGSTTVALVNWSANNYLKMPYSSNLDAAGDLSGSFWYKSPATASRVTIFERGYYTSGSYSGSNYRADIAATTSYLRSIVSDDAYSTTDSVATSTAVDDDQWHYGGFSYDKDGNLSLYGDGGALIGTDAVSASLLSLANSNASLYIGIAAALDAYFTNGYIAGLKIDIGNAWTAQKIKSDYESERVLFQPNEVYSVVGESLTLAVKATDSTPGIQQNKTYNEAHDGTREYIVKWTKGTYNLTLKPLNIRERNKVRKFLKSVAGQSFTLSERSFEYGADNEITVYKESHSDLTRVGRELNTVSFKVREV